MVHCNIDQEATLANIPNSNKPAAKVAKPAGVTPAKAQPVPVAAAKPAAPAKPPFAKEPVAAAPVAAPVAAPKKVEAVKIAAPTPEAVKPEPKIETPAAAPVAAAAPVKGTTMNDTITNAQDTMKTAATDMQNRATEMFGDVNARAKDAMAKGSKAIEELVEFSKGNVEAIVASGRVAAKGAEEIAKYSAEYGRTAVEKANATAKQFAAVKSPTEFFQLQGEVAKQTLDALVAEGSKFTENYLKLMGDISQPISNRVAVAAEKVKSTVSA